MCCWVVAGISKGVGFIRFDQRFEAERAIKLLNGTIPEGASEPITVKFANSPSSAKAGLVAGSNSAAAAMASLLTAAPQTTAVATQARRLLGPIHHPANRFRYFTHPFPSLSVEAFFCLCLACQICGASFTPLLSKAEADVSINWMQ